MEPFAALLTVQTFQLIFWRKNGHCKKSKILLKQLLAPVSLDSSQKIYRCASKRTMMGGLDLGVATEDNDFEVDLRPC